ncbi:MAG: hemolysin family protein [Ruminococcus sp.]|nr:hemolysin family protein [Ruminococcus sp.]
MLGQILLQILLIALNAVFACAEAAVISINDTRLEKLAASGDKRAVKLKNITGEPSRFLSTIRVAVTLSGFLGAAFAADNFSDRLTGLLMRTGIPLPERAVHVISVVLLTLILSYATLVLGELVPKRLAVKNPEKLGLGMAGFISFIWKLFAPFVRLLNASSNGILRLFGIDPEQKFEAVTEEEIIMMSDAGAEKGTIDETENRIIKNVFAFDDMTAEQICTHRTDVSVLWAEDSSEIWEETIHRTRHSVFPICGESVDNVVGVLNAKDYFRLEDKSKENIMKSIIREPYFVHENMKADRLFAQMKRNDADHFAVVVDEYGGMSGIITVTDLVEQLVGEFADDDLDEPALKFEQISDSEWNIPGITPLSEIAQELDIPLPADKYDTFGGYVIALLGEIPKDGTQTKLDTDELSINILEVRHHRIEKCTAMKKEKTISSETSSDEE